MQSASFVGAAPGRLGWGAAPLGGAQRRRPAACRRSVRLVAAADNSAWDTLSVDELQEWEVSAAAVWVGARGVGVGVGVGPLSCRAQALLRTRPPRCTASCHPAQETGPPTPLLDTVNFPVHLKNLGISDLKKLTKELRAGG